jgi:hypothetical protein
MSLARRPYTRGEIVWLLEFACVSIVEDQDAADLNSHPVPVLEQGRPPGRFAEFRRHPARLLESRVSLRSRHREGQIGEVGSLAGESDERVRTQPQRRARVPASADRAPPETQLIYLPVAGDDGTDLHGETGTPLSGMNDRWR